MAVVEASFNEFKRNLDIEKQGWRRSFRRN
jgi:hypothetical protein